MMTKKTQNVIYKYPYSTKRIPGNKSHHQNRKLIQNKNLIFTQIIKIIIIPNKHFHFTNTNTNSHLFSGEAEREGDAERGKGETVCVLLMCDGVCVRSPHPPSPPLHLSTGPCCYNPSGAGQRPADLCQPLPSKRVSKINQSEATVGVNSFLCYERWEPCAPLLDINHTVAAFALES